MSCSFIKFSNIWFLVPKVCFLFFLNFICISEADERYRFSIFEPAHEIMVLIFKATSEGSGSHTWTMEVDEGSDQKIRHLAPLDGSTCGFKECFGERKVPQFHELAHFIYLHLDSIPVRSSCAAQAALSVIVLDVVSCYYNLLFTNKSRGKGLIQCICHFRIGGISLFLCAAFIHCSNKPLNLTGWLYYRTHWSNKQDTSVTIVT